MPDAASRFTGLAAGYDSARPAPPPDLTAFLVQWSGVAAPDVVDIGAGTGLSTMVWAGVAAQVTALEPGPDMRSVLTAKVAARPAGPTRFTILDAVAERTGLPDASADIVTASTAMHWFDPVRALPEIRRVLRPGGLLVAYAAGLAAADRSRGRRGLRRVREPGDPARDRARAAAAGRRR